MDMTWPLGFVSLATIFVHGDTGRQWLLLALTPSCALRLCWLIYRKTVGKSAGTRYANLLHDAAAGSLWSARSFSCRAS